MTWTYSFGPISFGGSVNNPVIIDGIWNPNGSIKCGVVVPCGLVWKC